MKHNKDKIEEKVEKARKEKKNNSGEGGGEKKKSCTKSPGYGQKAGEIEPFEI